jgi:hypothetical protein
VIRFPWIWHIVIVMSAAGTAALMLANIHLPVRHLLSLWFLLTCPGMAYVRLLRINDGVTEWTLAVALSLAIDAIVAAFMLYTGHWSPDRGFVAVMALTLGGVIHPKSWRPR